MPVARRRILATQLGLVSNSGSVRVQDAARLAIACDNENSAIPGVENADTVPAQLQESGWKSVLSRSRSDSADRPYHVIGKVDEHHALGVGVEDDKASVAQLV